MLQSVFNSNNMDNFDKLVIAIKDIVIEWKGNKAEDIANEIKNRIMLENENLNKPQKPQLNIGDVMSSKNFTLTYD